MPRIRKLLSLVAVAKHLRRTHRSAETACLAAGLLASQSEGRAVAVVAKPRESEAAAER